MQHLASTRGWQLNNFIFSISISLSLSSLFGEFSVLIKDADQCRCCCCCCCFLPPQSWIMHVAHTYVIDSILLPSFSLFDCDSFFFLRELLSWRSLFANFKARCISFRAQFTFLPALQSVYSRDENATCNQTGLSCTAAAVVHSSTRHVHHVLFLSNCNWPMITSCDTYI